MQINQIHERPESTLSPTTATIRNANKASEATTFKTTVNVPVSSVSIHPNGHAVTSTLPAVFDNEILNEVTKPKSKLERYTTSITSTVSSSISTIPTISTILPEALTTSSSTTSFIDDNFSTLQKLLKNQSKSKETTASPTVDTFIDDNYKVLQQLLATKSFNQGPKIVSSTERFTDTNYKILQQLLDKQNEPKKSTTTTTTLRSTLTSVEDNLKSLEKLIGNRRRVTKPQRVVTTTETPTTEYLTTTTTPLTTSITSIEDNLKSLEKLIGSGGRRRVVKPVRVTATTTSPTTTTEMLTTTTTTTTLPPTTTSTTTTTTTQKPTTTTTTTTTTPSTTTSTTTAATTTSTPILKISSDVFRNLELLTKTNGARFSKAPTTVESTTISTFPETTHRFVPIQIPSTTQAPQRKKQPSNAEDIEFLVKNFNCLRLFLKNLFNYFFFSVNWQITLMDYRRPLR
jgi:hypothetical protein